MGPALAVPLPFRIQPDEAAAAQLRRSLLPASDGIPGSRYTGAATLKRGIWNPGSRSPFRSGNPIWCGWQQGPGSWRYATTGRPRASAVPFRPSFKAGEIPPLLDRGAGRWLQCARPFLDGALHDGRTFPRQGPYTSPTGFPRWSGWPGYAGGGWPDRTQYPAGAQFMASDNWGTRPRIDPAAPVVRPHCALPRRRRSPRRPSGRRRRPADPSCAWPLALAGLHR